jgi:hypothetical protein
MILLNLVNKSKGQANEVVVPVMRGNTDIQESSGMIQSMMRESKPISFPAIL